MGVMVSGVYAQLGSRSRTVLAAGCVVILAGVLISFTLAPLAGLIVLVCTWSPGVFLVGLALKLRQLDLRRSMSSWLYREHGLILPGDALRGGISFSPRGLFGDWRFEMPKQNGEDRQFWTVVREGGKHALYESGVLVASEVGVR